MDEEKKKIFIGIVIALLILIGILTVFKMNKKPDMTKAEIYRTNSSMDTDID